MHESLFTYNLTRPYPFKWVTWSVIVGGILATALFSTINFAANGYVLEVQYTVDPNGTAKNTQWFEKAPWTLVNKLSANCQPLDIAVNTPLFTTKLSLSYALADIWTEDQSGNITIYPSLTYLSNTLENCSIKNVKLHLQRFDSLDNGPYWIWEPTVVMLVATCSIFEKEGTKLINLTSTYSGTQNTLSSSADGSSFLQLNNQTKASIWWGQQLMYDWYFGFAEAMTSQPMRNSSAYPGTSVGIRGGTISLTRTETQNISSEDFFMVESWIYLQDGSLDYHNNRSVAEWISQNYFPTVFLQVDRLAKSYYSTVLADLGQQTGPNILTDSALTAQMFTGAPDQNNIFSGGLPNETYLILKDMTGPLSISPSTFYVEYECQVPQRKSAGSLVIAILVADLVFLQTLWKLFNWATTAWVQHKDPEANYCKRCATAILSGNGEQYQLVDTPTIQRTNTMSIGSRDIPSESEEHLFTTPVETHLGNSQY